MGDTGGGGESPKEYRPIQFARSVLHQLLNEHVCLEELSSGGEESSSLRRMQGRDIANHQGNCRAAANDHVRIMSGEAYSTHPY